MTDIIGIDEAGMGPIAGPLVAAAVVLPPSAELDIKDSKEMSYKSRIESVPAIYSIVWYAFIGSKSVKTINEEGLGRAHKDLLRYCAQEALKAFPDSTIIVDGNKEIEGISAPQKAVVQAENKYLAVAAASILAKVARDLHMIRLSAEFPAYRFHENMGYPTKAHKTAIEKWGICLAHRKEATPCAGADQCLVTWFNDERL